MKTRHLPVAIVVMITGYLFSACNNSAEEEKINEDSLNRSTLDNRDVDNRNVLIYDSNRHTPSDTVRDPK